MCATCGCSDKHDHGSHHHDHEHGTDGALVAGTRRIAIEEDILARNAQQAALNRAYFSAKHFLVLNLVSSPGSGKTSLLVETLKRFDGPAAVIEGDQETSCDAARIQETGRPAIQVNTGRGCHLDADMVAHAYAHLGVPENAVLFIENVGNLVCPAGFDLGEDKRVVIVSVTEGEDKPLKYSHIFATADLMIVSKADLLPHLDFDLAALIANAQKVNPKIAVLTLSVKSGEGVGKWLDWLKAAKALKAATA